MKILITSLLLFIGLSQVLARFLPWRRDNMNGYNGWMDDDYDLYGLPDDFYTRKFMLDSSLEKAIVLVRPVESGPLDGVFGTSRDPVLKNEEADANSMENTQIKSSEESQNNDDDDDRDYVAGKLLSKILAVLLSDENESSEDSKELYGKSDRSSEDSDEMDVFDLMDSSEETHNDNEAEAKNFVEIFNRKDKSDEATEIADMVKSTQELKANDDDIIFSFSIGFEALNDKADLTLTRKTKDDVAGHNELDDILEKLSSALDARIEPELRTKEIDSNAEVGNQIFITITAETESDEDDSSEETTTTSTTLSADTKEDNDDDNKSASGDNVTELVYVVLQGFDGDVEQQTLNDNKYSLINSQWEPVPTSAPHLLEDTAVSLFGTDVQSSIDEYLRIRESLDNQQDSLNKLEYDLDRDFYAIISNNNNNNNNKLEYDLDRDFYAIISNNPDHNTLNKFEKDFYAVQENLDQIRKTVNAMQNLQMKLYFHKLVTTAVERMRANNESKN